MNISSQTDNAKQINQTDFLGLAPFLRKNIAGVDLLPYGQEMLAQLQTNSEDAELWMNVSLVMFCLGHHEIGLSMQAQALALKNSYYLRAQQQPAKLRVLLLMVPGDLAANTPLDCLLENSDIDLIYYFLPTQLTADLSFPEHDILMVAISEADENLTLLTALESMLSDWPQPIVNRPEKIPLVGRTKAAQLLHGITGLLMPLTIRVARSCLQDIGQANIGLQQVLTDGEFPIIVRPVGSHAGRDLQKLDNLQDLHDYLDKVSANAFFIAPFIDYRGKDKLYRKYRIALIQGEAFACHMAISEHWMIHYVNAGMYESAQKRAEEAVFMQEFTDFARRHHLALQAIYTRTQLDYLCIDCAETADGALFLFEIDHAMVVHAMDPVALFPYKQGYLQKLQQAFRGMLFKLDAQYRHAS